MLTKLMALMNKPELNAQSTTRLYRALWEDEHISKGMLASHLDPNSDGATNNHTFVFKSVQWIGEIAPASKYNALLDLGSGAGVYAERFAREGYAVTGVDFSKRSIEYAREQTKRNDSGINYFYGDYLTIDYTAQFDMVTLINKDYAALPLTDRMLLLKKVHQALKPGGKFIFDVMTPKRRRNESRTWTYYENGDFFSEKPHLLLEAIYQYEDDDKTELYQYTVVTSEDVKCFITQNHFFTKKLLMSEIQPVEFSHLAFYDDIAGKAYSGKGETICCVATK